MTHNLATRSVAAFGLIATTAILAFLPELAFAQSVESGEKVFKKCKACHQIGADAKNKTGPVLTDVIGRQAGSYEGYKYSKSMKQVGEAGLIWDEDALFDYLLSPKNFLRATLDDPKAKAKMSFRLKPDQDRRDVIAYLATFAPATLGDSAVCTTNLSDNRYFFAAEATGSSRVTGWLEPNEQLCATASVDGAHGVVSVFETEHELEGCSRIVRAGEGEDLLKYADFDRCKWTGHED